MGKAMKSKPLQKGPKAKAKAKSSCKKNKTVGKKAMKTLTSANLRRFEKSQGQMSLQDKLKKQVRKRQWKEQRNSCRSS